MIMIILDLAFLIVQIQHKIIPPASGFNVMINIPLY